MVYWNLVIGNIRSILRFKVFFLSAVQTSSKNSLSIPKSDLLRWVIPPCCRQAGECICGVHQDTCTVLKCLTPEVRVPSGAVMLWSVLGLFLLCLFLALQLSICWVIKGTVLKLHFRGFWGDNNFNPYIFHDQKSQISWYNFAFIFYSFTFLFCLILFLSETIFGTQLNPYKQ